MQAKWIKLDIMIIAEVNIGWAQQSLRAQTMKA